jgi:antitoxin component YwqK of YwqJK toxin-antitoxin module
MKKVLLLFLILSIFFSCQQKPEKKTETYEDGAPKMEQYFVEDNLTKEVTYYKNQQKRYEGEYLDGKRHGRWVYWYPNGNVWSEGFFYQGENDSIRIVYHENGNKYYSGKYKKGQRTGVWKFWDEEGNFIKKVDYSVN